jgi:hypothetical protein
MLTFPLHFRIKENISVTVSKIFKDVFDFEFMMANGSKRTFRWKENSWPVYRQRNGRIDKDIMEAIGIFLKKLRDE